MSRHLYCITKNRTNPAYDGARLGAARAAARHGCRLINLAPAKPDDVDEQRALLEQAIAAGPDAILIAPAHPSALDATLQEAGERGITLVYFVCASDAVPARTFVTADNHALARGIAGHLARHLEHAGAVAVLEGSEASPTTEPRSRGFLDALASHPGIRIVARARGNYQKADATRAMRDIIARHKAIDGVICANDYMAMGVLDALDEAGHTARVVGINAMPEAIEAIRSGRLLATAAYDAMSMACIATEAALRLLAGETMPAEISLPVAIVDASNCDVWNRPFEARPLPDWPAAITTG